MRYYVGDDTADLLDVPKADWTRLLFAPLADVSRRLSLEELHRRLLRGLSQTDRVRHACRSPSGPSAMADGPRSQVPTSLAARWNLPPYSGPGGS